MASQTIALPRPSATVVLVRASAAEPQVFMVKRHAKSSFGSAFAFPGGVLEEDDNNASDFCDGLENADANLRLGLSSEGMAYYVAAIRELFEETGVLLTASQYADSAFDAERDALNDGSMSWREFIAKVALRLDCSALHYVSHWITPEARKRRYSTRFFVAAMPEGQTAAHCGGELTDSRWTTATEALAAERADEIELHFPTIKTLESVARHKTYDALLDWAKSSVDWGVTSMVPQIIQRDGRSEIVLPGDKDYPGAKS